MLGGLVCAGVGAARAVVSVLAVLAAVGAGEENVVQKEFDCADSSGSVGDGATAIGAFGGLLDGKHETNLFLAWRAKYTPSWVEDWGDRLAQPPKDRSRLASQSRWVRFAN